MIGLPVIVFDVTLFTAKSPGVAYLCEAIESLV